MQKMTNIYQNYDRNGTKLSSMYRIALSTEKKIGSAAQLKHNNFEDFSPQRNLRNVSK